MKNPRFSQGAGADGRTPKDMFRIGTDDEVKQRDGRGYTGPGPEPTAFKQIDPQIDTKLSINRAPLRYSGSGDRKRGLGTP